WLDKAGRLRTGGFVAGFAVLPARLVGGRVEMFEAAEIRDDLGSDHLPLRGRAIAYGLLGEKAGHQFAGVSDFLPIEIRERLAGKTRRLRSVRIVCLRA